MTEIDSNLEEVLSIILNMQKTYTEYLEQTNETNKQNNKIQIQGLKLEQDFHIGIKEIKQVVTFFQEQVKKLKRYKKIIDILQSPTFAKLDISIPSIEKPTQIRLLLFTHALSPHANIFTSSRQPTIQITYTLSKNSSSRSEKLTKALPDPPIFIDGKDLSIDKCLSKI